MVWEKRQSQHKPEMEKQKAATGSAVAADALKAAEGSRLYAAATAAGALRWGNFSLIRADLPLRSRR